MKKLIEFAIPFKAFAAMLFAGLIMLYMVSGVIFVMVTGEAFDYSIPFIFVLQGVGFSVLASLLWSVFYTNVFIRKWRFFLRHIMFELSLVALFAVCILTFFAVPTAWGFLWLIVTGFVTIFVIILFGLSEMYYRKTGRLYTEKLKLYKEMQNK
jgi:hypothetical protein